MYSTVPRIALGDRIDRDAWDPVLEVAGPAAVRLLDALAQAGVPAFASPVRPHLDVWRLWTATGHGAAADQVLLDTLPDMVSDDEDRLR